MQSSLSSWDAPFVVICDPGQAGRIGGRSVAELIRKVEPPRQHRGLTGTEDRPCGDLARGRRSVRDDGHLGQVDPVTVGQSVPGGVGPLTIACLLANTVRAACVQAGLAPPALGRQSSVDRE